MSESSFNLIEISLYISLYDGLTMLYFHPTISYMDVSLSIANFFPRRTHIASFILCIMVVSFYKFKIIHEHIGILFPHVFSAHLIYEASKGFTGSFIVVP